jgi:putative peptidoglycan lipid II flippase
VLSVIYGGGQHAFSPDDIARGAAVLAGFAPAVWVYSLNHVLTRAFYAKGNTVTPMRLAVGAVALNFGLNLALIWPLREAGLAWSTATSALVQLVALSFLAPRHLGVRPFDTDTWAATARIAAASIGMGAVVWATSYFWPATTTWVDNALKLAATVAAGGATYAGLAWAFGLSEMKWLLHRSPRTGETSAMSFE